MTRISCSHREQNPRRGFRGDAALNFSALAFSPSLAFYDSLFSLLEAPSTDLLGAHLAGCPLRRHPNLSCCWRGTSITHPGGEEHHIRGAVGRAGPLAWLPPGAESERLMSEQRHCPPPLFP